MLDCKSPFKVLPKCAEELVINLQSLLALHGFVLKKITLGSNRTHHEIYAATYGDIEIDEIELK